MATDVPDRAAGFLRDLRTIFGERLRSVASYGERGDASPLTCLVLVTSLDLVDLDACARAASRWRRGGFATPLLLPELEFRRSFDAFPLEYSEMERTHTLLLGDDPFRDVSISPADLRRACETQVKSHLLHLREGYVEAGGRPDAVAELVDASAGRFASLLRNVARLHGAPARDGAAAARDGARLAGVPDDVVDAILTLEHADGMGTTDPARLYPAYLAAVERLAMFVDSWRGVS